ncbi:MAG: hypothetical protein EAZ06_05720 [Cytophagales bacterium]|nr:MAG: hypothetical protein EAZ06_05720 [Cytophagales bacterium]
MKYLLLFCLLYLVYLPAQAQGKKIIDSMIYVYKTAKYDTTRIMALTSIAYEYRNEKPDTCISIAEKALQMSEKIGFEKGKGWALNRMAEGKRTQKDFNTASSLLQKAQQSFEKAKDLKGLAWNYNIWACVYQLQKKIPLAIKNHKKSIEVYEKINNKQSIVDNLIDIAGIYSEQNNTSLAIEYYLKSLKIADKRRQAYIFKKMDVIYFNQKNYALSLEYALKSLKIYQKIGKKEDIASISMNIGVSYYEQGKYELSLEYLQKSLKLREQIGYNYGIAAVLLCLGELYIRQKQYPLALENLEKSLKMVERGLGTYEKLIALYCLNDVADIYQKQKKYDKSIEYAQKSMEIAKELKVLVEIGIVSKTLFKAYKGKGDYANALQYLELHKQTEDSFFSVNKTKALANLEAKAEIEKQQIEIEKQKEAKEFQQYINYLILTGFCSILAFAVFIYRAKQKEKKAKELITEQKEEIDQQNTFLVAQSKELETANQTKDKLFAIIGHDLRSLISSLESMLNLINQKMITYEEFYNFVPQFHKNVKNMQNTLENLLQWSIAQMEGISTNPTSINLNGVIDENIQLFTEIAKVKTITITAKINNEIKAWADANHVRLLLRNLINNALKFTPNNGYITIKAYSENNQAIISVIDSGVGMSEEQVKKIFQKNQTFTTYGTKRRKRYRLRVATLSRYCN